MDDGWMGGWGLHKIPPANSLQLYLFRDAHHIIVGVRNFQIVLQRHTSNVLYVAQEFVTDSF